MSETERYECNPLANQGDVFGTCYFGMFIHDVVAAAGIWITASAAACASFQWPWSAISAEEFVPSKETLLDTNRKAGTLARRRRRGEKYKSEASVSMETKRPIETIESERPNQPIKGDHTVGSERPAGQISSVRPTSPIERERQIEFDLFLPKLSLKVYRFKRNAPAEDWGHLYR